MRWRKQTRKPTSPNFLFSLPPFIEDGYEVPTIVLAPSGIDDSKPMQAAGERLWATGGGVLRLSIGDYVLSDPFYMDDWTEGPRGT